MCFSLSTSIFSPTRCNKMVFHFIFSLFSSSCKHFYLHFVQLYGFYCKNRKLFTMFTSVWPFNCPFSNIAFNCMTFILNDKMSFTMRATVVLFQSSYFYCNLKSVKSIIFPLNFPFKLSAIVVLCQSNLHFFMLFYQFNISRQVVVLYPHIFHSFPQLTKLFH